MRQLLTMTASDLRQRVRDRSVLIFALLVPLALMFVFNLVFGGAQDIELEPVTIAVSSDPQDQLASTLVTTLEEVEVLDVTVLDVAADRVGAAVEAGSADLGLVVVDGFGEAVRTASGGDVEVIEGDGADLESDILLAVVQGVLERFAAGTVAATAGAELGLPPEQLAAIAREAATSGPAVELVQGRVSDEQLSAGGAVVAGQAGLFLLFTVGFGVLALIDERQHGTLARLQSMPMRPGLIVAAKGLVSFVLGVVATSVLLVVGGLFFGVSFGSPVAVAVLVLCVVAAATSLMFIVVRVARTAEQAGIMQSILAMVLGVAGGAFFPIAAPGAIAQVLDLNPVAAFTRGLGIAAGGGGVGDLGGPVLICLGFTVLMLAAARLLPDRGVVGR